tara:strand:+ start:234 stop:938 length:705 start_codon:yes stop_codon:yes gene_type:complete
VNIGILSSKDDLLLSYYVKKLKKNNNYKIFIFYAHKDKKKVLKDNHIFKDRTKNYFKKDFFNISKIKKFYFKSHNSVNFKKKLKFLKIDYLFNSGTPNKINLEIIKSVQGIINIHPGILPDYRGSTCVEWALYNNDPVGISAHLMTEKYDTGPIISKKFLNLKNSRKYEDIRIKVYLESINQIINVLKILKKGNIKSSYISKNKIYKVISDKKLNEIKKLLNKNKYKFHKKNLN